MSGSLLLHNYMFHDRGTEKDPSMFNVYEKHCARFIGIGPVVVEIGVNNGKSLDLWKQFFGVNSFIVGVDINPNCAIYGEGSAGKYVYIGDATKPEVLDQVLGHFGPPDIVIDDGSHRSEDIIATFEYMYPRMARHGVYIVEDLHMCWDNGVPVQNSFIEYSKGLLDETQALFRKARPREWFSRSTIGMSMYQSIAVFERGLPFHAQTHPTDSYVSFKQPWGDDIKTMRRDSPEVPFPPESAVQPAPEEK